MRDPVITPSGVTYDRKDIDEHLQVFIYLFIFYYVKKVKADVALPGENPTSELWDVTCNMGSHSVTCHPTQVNAPPPNPSPSHAGWYSIYLPWRDGRLS